MEAYFCRTTIQALRAEPHIYIGSEDMTESQDKEMALEGMPIPWQWMA
jgi:hypothetical protein